MWDSGTARVTDELGSWPGVQTSQVFAHDKTLPKTLHRIVISHNSELITTETITLQIVRLNLESLGAFQHTSKYARQAQG